MDYLLDSVWEQIELILNMTVASLDRLLSPIEILGSGFVILFLSFFVVGLTRLIARFYVTKRFIVLKKEFEHWQGIRQEAMKHPDQEKGRALAKNIDQAQLNKVYYDYFFEGLLKNLVTNVLPILLTAAYVTRVYTPQALMERFGNQWIYTFSAGSAFIINISSLLWFALCVCFWFVLFFVIVHWQKPKRVEKAYE